MRRGSGGGNVTICEPSAVVVGRVSATGYSMGIGGERLRRHSPAMTAFNPIAFDRPRAKLVISGIFAVLTSGAYIDRAFIVRRFIEGGYVERLAIRYADALIARNTDIQHHSRWSVWGTNGRETYSFSA